MDRRSVLAACVAAVPKPTTHWLLAALLLASIVSGSVVGYTQDCPPLWGDGSDTSCLFDGMCGDLGGGTYMYCVYVNCGHSLACQGQWQYSEQKCAVMGCWLEWFYDFCNYCPNGGR